MRLLKLGIYPDAYLNRFYLQRDGLEQQPYTVQHRALIDDCFGSSDFWTSELKKLGYETTDIIANAGHLQRSWARERNFAHDENKWLFQIASEQIKSFRPDILLIADYSTFTGEFIRNIRRDCPNIKLILGWCGAPYRDLSVFREWDAVLSCVPEMVANFRNNGLDSYHVNHAFAPRILTSIDRNAPPKIDFGFVGSVIKQDQFHGKREKLLLHLASSTKLELWSDLSSSIVEKKGSLNIRNRLREIVRRSPKIDKKIIDRSHRSLFGLEMFQKLSEMRIVFNNHIDISPVSASNMRLFETTGVGACLITDWKDNLTELFEPEKEVVTYKSAEECTEKVKYLLENENDRRSIAEAGQRRTLRDHTFESRAERIDEVIRKILFPKK